MRKILLATTALVGVALAGSVQAAATSPISLNVGGYDDFIAGVYHEAPGTTPGTSRAHYDFEDEYKISFDALGKASNGIEYGANISLWNGPEVGNLWRGGGSTVELNSAYVWLSGAFGKVLFGDEHGASDLQVYAPTVGEGQIDGRYMDFVSPLTLARVYASGIDNTEHSTKVTYYTPKVGNEANKVQAGVSYAPNMYDYGSNVTKFNTVGTTALGNGATSPYTDYTKGTLAYWGNWHPVTLAASANIATASAGSTASSVPALFSSATTPAGGFQDFTSWGLGAQVGYSGLPGFTLGGSYQDLGRYGTTHGQNKDQDVWSIGGKYEFDKVAVAANYLTSSQYDNLLTGGGIAGKTFSTTNTNYVSSFNAWGAGATYTWFPGLTSAIDGVLFQQGVSNQADTNDGYVLMLSQKLTF